MKSSFTSYVFTLIICSVISCFAVEGIKNYYINQKEDDIYVYISDGIRGNPKNIDNKLVECAWCHRKKNLNRHHIIPKSANPALKNNLSNIVVRCRDCHFVLGHRCNWKKFNPDVMNIVETYTNNIVSAEYRKNLNDEISAH